MIINDKINDIDLNYNMFGRETCKDVYALFFKNLI